MFEKSGKTAEIVTFIVLDDYNCALLDSTALQNEHGHFGKARHIVGRVSENYVEWFGDRGQEAKDVALIHGDIVRSKLAHNLADEIILRRGFLYTGDVSTFARQELQGYRSGAGKKVQRRGTLQINEIFDDVEDIFAGEVGGGPGGDIGGHVEAPTAVFASDYSHSEITEREKGARMAAALPWYAAAGNIAGIT